MKIFITGGRGMLGRTLQHILTGHQLTIADLPHCDITIPQTVEKALDVTRPDVVIHCAAMTKVDACETHAQQAYAINATGSGNVAKACNRLGIRLIAMSTDYVFGGDLNRPYHEDDPAGNPSTVYGKTKFAGEELIRAHCPNHLICRIAWLYGAGGPSFLHTMLALADGTRPVLNVVDDQHGNPTSTDAVAHHLAIILKHPELTGTFHLTCEGEATWYEFAQEIFRLNHIKQKTTPCSTADFPRPAPRPLNSRLEKRRLKQCGLPPMPDWHDALKDFLAEHPKG